jgi:hypothetical protein
MSHVSAGKRVACRCPGLSPWLTSATGCARRWPCLACSSSLFLVRRGADPLDPVTITATREPQALEPQQRRRRRHRRRNHPHSTADSVETRAPRCGRADRAQRRPRPDLGPFRPRHRHEQHVVLVDGVRVGSATLGQAEFEA